MDLSKLSNGDKAFAGGVVLFFLSLFLIGFRSISVASVLARTDGTTGSGVS
jgi:hypothetical protein